MDENKETAPQEVLTVKPKKADGSLLKFVYSVLAVLSGLFVLGVFFGRIVFFPISVKGTSMQPTLNASAKSETESLDVVYLGSAANVKLRDIVVFDSKSYTGDSDLYIKRVIAVPGDVVEFRASEINAEWLYYEVYVNGVMLTENYIKEPMRFNRIYHSDIEEAFVMRYIEGNKKIELLSNEYFLMGDNRNVSTDSRLLGPIKKKDFVGKVYLQIKSGQNIVTALFDKIF